MVCKQDDSGETTQAKVHRPVKNCTGLPTRAADGDRDRMRREKRTTWHAFRGPGPPLVMNEAVVVDYLGSVAS